MRPHRHGQLHEHVHRVGIERRRLEADERREQRGAVGEARRLLVHDFDLIALEHGDVQVLRRLLAAMMFDDQQARRRDFDHQAQRWNRLRRSPDDQAVAVPRHAEVDAGPLHRRREPHERGRVERQRMLEDQRMLGLFRGQERERNFRDVAFLATQARPERRVHHRFDRGGVGDAGQRRLAALTRLRQVPREVVVHRWRDAPGSGIRGTGHFQFSMNGVQ